jgi:endonuclease III related protein
MAAVLAEGQGSRQRFLLDVYSRLWLSFGPQHWWPGDTAFEIIIGAILTQSTSWSNVTMAIDNLKQAGLLSPQALAAVPDGELAALIRPSGYYRAKARKVRAFLDMLATDCAGDVDRLLALDTHNLRRLLLRTHGIGPETADAIILYAAGRPLFVIDAYTRRILSRLGICPASERYDDLQDLFMDNLPPDATMFNEYHALLVRLGKTTCAKSAPRCLQCPLRQVCLMGMESTPPAGQTGSASA